MCLGSCLSSYTAQNIGAGKQERIPLGFKTGVKLSEITVIPFFILYFIFSRQMMGLFLDDRSMEAIQAGIAFLRIVSPLYFIIAVKIDDGRNYQRCRRHDVFHYRNSTGSDSANLFRTLFYHLVSVVQEFGWHGRLVGLLQQY